MAKWPVSTGSLIANVPSGIGVSGGEGLHICDKNEGVHKGNNKGGKRDDQGNEWQQYAMTEALTTHFQALLELLEKNGILIHCADSRCSSSNGHNETGNSGMCICLYLYECLYIYLHMQVDMNMYVLISTLMYAYLQNFVSMYLCKYICMNIYILQIYRYTDVHVCMYVCMYTFMEIYIFKSKPEYPDSKSIPVCTDISTSRHKKHKNKNKMPRSDQISMIPPTLPQQLEFLSKYSYEDFFKDYRLRKALRKALKV
jgi:hypothetical protein